MNPNQTAQQIAHELRAITWPAAGGEVVFGQQGVAVVDENPSKDQVPPGYPLALVTQLDGTADEQDPARLEVSFQVASIAMVKGDPSGSYALIGGPIANRTSSQGRGATEVAERAAKAVGDLTGSDGRKLVVSATSTPSVGTDEAGDFVGVVRFNVRALCTTEPHYAAPQELRHDATTNAWLWAGDQCSGRFDFLRYRLVRKAGTSAPADPSDGETLYSGTPATWVGPKESGFTYAAFADYNDRGGSTVADSSSPVVGAYVAV